MSRWRAYQRAKAKVLIVHLPRLRAQVNKEKALKRMSWNRSTQGNFKEMAIVVTRKRISKVLSELKILTRRLKMREYF